MVLTGEGSDETMAGYRRYAFTLKNAALDPLTAIWSRLIEARVRESISDSRWIGANLRRKLSHTFLGQRWGLLAIILFRQFLLRIRREWNKVAC